MNIYSGQCVWQICQIISSGLQIYITSAIFKMEPISDGTISTHWQCSGPQNTNQTNVHTCTHIWHVSLLRREKMIAFSIQDIHNFGHVEFNHYLSNKGPFLQKIKIELDTILWSWRYETFEKDSVINLWRVRIWKRNDPFKWCEPFVCWCCCCCWYLCLASGFYNFFGLNVLMLSGKSSC